MATMKRPNVSQRNLIWLVLIVAVTITLGLLASWLVGGIAGLVVLAVSEAVERVARSNRATSPSSAEG